MKEIIIRVKNKHRESERNLWDGQNSFELIIDGKPIHRVKRFAIDIDSEKLNSGDRYQDITYSLEKYLNINEQYYEETDTLKEYEDWCRVKNG